MLILLGMLLIGLFAGIWGFLMFFFPDQWDRLTEAIGGPTPRWMYPGPRPLAPIIKLGNRPGGLVICIEPPGPVFNSPTARPWAVRRRLRRRRHDCNQVGQCIEAGTAHSTDVR